MAEVLTVPADVVRYDSDLVDDAFAETLANSLLLHHAIHEEPLNKESFEYVMKGYAQASGQIAELNPGRGTATWDLRIGGAGWSLKTEAARGISPGTVKIEKLMEARWIRECTNPAKCAADVRAHVPAHMAGYDRILVLGAYRESGRAGGSPLRIAVVSSDFRLRGFYRGLAVARRRGVGGVPMRSIVPAATMLAGGRLSVVDSDTGLWDNASPMSAEFTMASGALAPRQRHGHDARIQLAKGRLAIQGCRTVNSQANAPGSTRRRKRAGHAPPRRAGNSVPAGKTEAGLLS